MTYKTVQTGVDGVIRKISGYDTTNVKVDDYRILATGILKGVILRRGPARRTPISMGSPVTYDNRWTVNAELFVPFVDSTSGLADSVIVEAQKVIDEISKWPQLDGTAGVIDAVAEALTEPEEWLMGRNSRWWRQVVAITAQELIEVTLSE